jgi:hypothetical protein
MIYGELGACTMSVYIQTRIINFWSKLVNCENSKLSSIINKDAFVKHTQNGLEMRWIKAVKNILWTRSNVSKFEKPQISQPYNRIGLTILSKRSY